MKLKKNFTYIDLFAGIGGFHCAMNEISGGKAECIFASEIDANAKEVYKNNFDIEPLGDIRNIDPSNFKSFDVVCGGFPCQTFSKAGKQDGFKDPRGTLFKEIIRIIEYYPFERRPKILFLENVRNLISHDEGFTWKTIRHEISKIGYNVINVPLVVSPKDVGVPQLRDRALILAVREDLYKGDIVVNIEKKSKNSLSIYDVLSDQKEGSKEMTEQQEYAVKCREEFIQNINRKIIGFPIWSDEFGKKYLLDNLPKWKQKIILSNRKLYEENKEFINRWLKKRDIRQKLIPTYRKFEWQVGNKINSPFEGIIQFRPSGIRVKLPTESPALVALVQLPYIGAEKRSISIKEAVRLQSFPDTFIPDKSCSQAFKQFGNAVNVKVIKHVFSEFLKSINCTLED